MLPDKITRPGLTMMLTLLPSVVVGPVCGAPGAPLSPRTPPGVYATPSQNLAALLVSGAQNQIARHGFEVVDPRLVEMATRGRVPSSLEMAAEIVQSAKLD